MGDKTLSTSVERAVRPEERPTTRTARTVAMTAYVLVLAAYSKLVGLPADTIQVFAWMWLGVTAWNIQAPRRTHLVFLRDWWPALVVLEVYVYSRGVTAHLGLPVHITEPIRADNWLGAGELPTQHLQQQLCGSPCTRGLPPHWYDGVLTSVYYTHFVAAPLVALVLWLRDRVRWQAFMRRYVTLFIGGLYGYITYPMAPPWMASRDGYVTGAPVPRITGRGWSEIGLEHFQQWLARLGNQVAAMPSLHAGTAALVAFYGISRLRSRWRFLLLLYPSAMSFMLVYYGEHYVVDIVAGWLLAGLVMVACANWERGGQTKRAATAFNNAILEGDRRSSVRQADARALAFLRRLPSLAVPCVLLALTVVGLMASPYAAISALVLVGGFVGWLTATFGAEVTTRGGMVRACAAAVVVLGLGYQLVGLI